MATMVNLLETGEVARILNLSVERVKQLANDGRLPVAARTGAKTRLYRREDVLKLKAAREKAGR